MITEKMIKLLFMIYFFIMMTLQYQEYHHISKNDVELIIVGI